MDEGFWNERDQENGGNELWGTGREMNLSEWAESEDTCIPFDSLPKGTYYSHCFNNQAEKGTQPWQVSLFPELLQLPQLLIYVART